MAVRWWKICRMGNHGLNGMLAVNGNLPGSIDNSSVHRSPDKRRRGQEDANVRKERIYRRIVVP